MTSIGSGSTYVRSVDPSSDQSRGGSETILVANEPSNLTPPKVALYVYPDFREATPRKVWTKWADGHRKIQHPGGVYLRAGLSEQT
jgi:hypothetical protein